MTLVNARAAFEAALNTAITDADENVVVVFDNMPYTTPGKNTTYVMININFTQSTYQPHGAALDFYGGTIRCAIFTPMNRGSAAAAAVAESVIDGLTSVNASGYTDSYSTRPHVGEISGPTAVTSENNSHFLSVVNCRFSATA
jgi:hypothetical protein